MRRAQRRVSVMVNRAGDPNQDDFTGLAYDCAFKQDFQKMDYVRLGRTGLEVSKFCLGCMTYGAPRWRDWVLDEEASRPFLKRAL
jgi:hypothetical protein